MWEKKVASWVLQAREPRRSDVEKCPHNDRCGPITIHDLLSTPSYHLVQFPQPLLYLQQQRQLPDFRNKVTDNMATPLKRAPSRRRRYSTNSLEGQRGQLQISKQTLHGNIGLRDRIHHFTVGD